MENTNSNGAMPTARALRSKSSPEAGSGLSTSIAIAPPHEADEMPFVSNCCGRMSSMMEYGICPTCHEHCSFEKYDEDGGVIEVYQL